MTGIETATVRIPLSNGRETIVDADQAHLVADRKWHMSNTARDLYYAVSGGLLMHRLLIQATKGLIVDHINGDGLDNRLANLRLCTNQQNMCNQRKQSGTSSRFKGVNWNKADERWVAKIHKDGRTVHLGQYTDEELAARQYDRAARLMFGRFARTNAMIGLL